MRNPDNEIISVLIVHEHAVVCEGLRLLIANNTKMQAVGVASSRSEAILLAESKLPDVILLDLDFDGEDGLSLLPQLREVTKNSSRVLVLTTMRHSQEYRKAVRLGASGVVLNKEGPDLLMKAIEKVHQGEVWVDRSMMGRLLRDLAEVPDVDSEQEKIASLTEREREVISFVGKGLKNRQIAQRLFVCETTVSHRLSSVFSKLDVSDRLELVIYAFSNGLAQVPRRKTSSRNLDH